MLAVFYFDGNGMESHWTDFFPYVFMGIKVIALCIAGFFAIKWHVDQDKKLKKEARNKDTSE